MKNKKVKRNKAVGIRFPYLDDIMVVSLSGILVNSSVVHITMAYFACFVQSISFALLFHF